MSKKTVLYKGESPIAIQAGEFSGQFTPNETYEVPFRFAVHLTESEENFEIVPEVETKPETLESLLKKSKPELVELAKDLTEKPDSLNKQQLAELILGGNNNG